MKDKLHQKGGKAIDYKDKRIKELSKYFGDLGEINEKNRRGVISHIIIAFMLGKSDLIERPLNLFKSLSEEEKKLFIVEFEEYIKNYKEQRIISALNVILGNFRNIYYMEHNGKIKDTKPRGRKLFPYF